MKLFSELRKAFTQSLSYEELLGIKDSRTGLPKDFAGNVVDRKYIVDQIRTIKEQIKNEPNQERKADLIDWLNHWYKALDEFEEKHGKCNNINNDLDYTR